jgi:hypothetical protein
MFKAHTISNISSYVCAFLLRTAVIVPALTLILFVLSWRCYLEHYF